MSKEAFPIHRIAGSVSEQVEAILGLSITGDRNIYLGDSNLLHMQTSHPKDWEKYGAELFHILTAPDYVGQNPKDGSIEYVKEFLIDSEYVKVAVRLSGNGTFYARSLYVLNPNRVNNFIQKGTLKKV